MASINGIAAKAGVKIATTWGTAVACTESIIAEITPSGNTQELIAREIGSGNAMATSATFGSIKPTVSITSEWGATSAAEFLLAQLFGTSAAPTEATASQADYPHNIVFNTTRNAKYVTVAWQDASATTMEIPTAAVRSFTLKSTSIPGYVEYTAELVGSSLSLSSSTNTTASLNSCATVSGLERLTCTYEDYFWINSQSSGAVSSSDKLNITSWEVTYTQPQELPDEMKGSAGNGAPVIGGLFETSLKITCKDMGDHTYFTLWSAETALKAKLNFEGSQIGTGTNKGTAMYFPALRLIKEPGNALTNPGFNPLTLEFRGLKALAAPTGMSVSTYPYIIQTNNRAGSLLA
jgi:hypothetical protein